MAKSLNLTTGIVALIGLAPWCVFLGGLAKLTDVLTDFNFSQAVKQTVIMLEWYILSAQFINVILIMIAAVGRNLHRSHSLLNMFLAVNTALLILQATARIYQINRYKDGEDGAALLGVTHLHGSPLPYLRALAAGEVATATWNFFLAILVGYSGTNVPHVEHAFKASAPMTA